MSSVSSYFPVIAPDDLMSIPVGSIIFVGAPLDGSRNPQGGSSWFVFTEGKGILMERSFPDSETEDLDWFVRWSVSIIGFNEEYAKKFAANNLEYANVPAKPRDRRKKV